MADEYEAKVSAAEHLRLPDLTCLAQVAAVHEREPVLLEAVYYDTHELTLARWGITLRRRTGEPGPPWTLKLPGSRSGSVLVRSELTFDDDAISPPAAVDQLLVGLRRGAPLVPVAQLDTVRRTIELIDDQRRILADIDDDHVTVRRGDQRIERFREIEVELRESSPAARRLLDQAVDLLTDAGCHRTAPLPKVVRTLGPAALGQPDVVIPSLGLNASVAEVVGASLARSVTQLLRHDPRVRLGDDPEDVHQFRVATRRLRSDLRTFAPVLDRAATVQLRGELATLADAAGAVRDLDVLGLRLRAGIGRLPAGDAAAAQGLLDVLAAQQNAARQRLFTVMSEADYARLVDDLVAAAAGPPLEPRQRRLLAGRARRHAVAFTERPYKRLSRAVRQLGDDPSDAELHQVRILAKRCRYAVEALVPVTGRRSAALADALADLQTVLGEANDTVVAEQWLRAVATEVSTAAAVCAGELIAGELRARKRWRARFLPVWTTVVRARRAAS